MSQETAVPEPEPTVETESVRHAPPLSAAAKRRRWLRRIGLIFLKGVGLIALSLVCAGLIVTTYGARSYHWKAFEIEFSMRPAMHGETRLIFAPLGEIRARTHRTPLFADITLKAVAFEELKNLVLHMPPRNELEKDFEKTARASVQDFAIRQMLLGAAGALLAPLFLRLRRARWWLFCAFSGASLIVLVFFTTMKTFNTDAFKSPRYTGSLGEYTQIVTLVKTAFDSAETLTAKLKLIADNLDTLYGRINAVAITSSTVGTINVLHISDLHNNEKALDFLEHLAAKVRIDVVVDTGDLTDFGSPLENRLAARLANIKEKYVYAAGNHDSQATIAAVRAHPNATVLEGRAVDVAGLRILGAPDPNALRPGPGANAPIINFETASAALKEDMNTPLSAIDATAAQLNAAFDADPRKPDLICVHNPRMAAPLVGKARVILCGHLHQMRIERKDNTLICNAGTTGASGIRYITDSRTGDPLTAEILYFSRDAQPRLLYIDQIRLEANLYEYSIQRTSYDTETRFNP